MPRHAKPSKHANPNKPKTTGPVTPETDHSDAEIVQDASKIPVIKAGSSHAKKVKKDAGLTQAATQARSKKEIHPGKERWSVKTGMDLDRGLVDVHKRVEATVDELVGMPRPNDMLPPTDSFPGYDQHRAHPVETTVWTITGEIIAYKEEDDGDYHLVIQEGTGPSGHTMIAEAPDPDPNFVNASSPWAQPIAAARKAIDQKLKPEHGVVKKARQKARITGVGFFDKIHGQLGVAHTNGVELHPILLIEWL